MQEAQLEVLSYDDSLFTNAHDLVSPKPVNDGRGTFTHLGVRMEGLESSRHWNLKSEKDASGSMVFWRDHTIVNNVHLRLRGPSTRMLISELVFDTSFYTKNPSKDVYSVEFLDDQTGKRVSVVEKLVLLGDAVKRVTLNTPTAVSRVHLRLGEGGLTRFKMFGTPLAPLTQLPSLLPHAKTFGVSDASYGDPSLVLREAREGSIMAGWESCRHSARHRLGLILSKKVLVERVEVDTYMHCLNPFRFICVLSANVPDACESDLLASLPSWTIDPSNTVVSDENLNDYMEKHSGMLHNDHGPVKYSMVPHSSKVWNVLVPFSPLKRDTFHEYVIETATPATHLMFIGVPDGGVHRIGVYGKL